MHLFLLRREGEGGLEQFLGNTGHHRGVGCLEQKRGRTLPVGHSRGDFQQAADSSRIVPGAQQSDIAFNQFRLIGMMGEHLKQGVPGGADISGAFLQDRGPDQQFPRFLANQLQARGQLVQDLGGQGEFSLGFSDPGQLLQHFFTFRREPMGLLQRLAGHFFLAEIVHGNRGGFQVGPDRLFALRYLPLAELAGDDLFPLFPLFLDLADAGECAQVIRLNFKGFV